MKRWTGWKTWRKNGSSIKEALGEVVDTDRFGNKGNVPFVGGTPFNPWTVAIHGRWQSMDGGNPWTVVIHGRW